VDDVFVEAAYEEKLSTATRNAGQEHFDLCPGRFIVGGFHIP